MKIIDILNKMANKELEDEFKFKYRGDTYRYNKNSGELENFENDCINFGDTWRVEEILNDEVEVIEEKKELEEKLDWKEIIDSVGKPIWDNKRKKWRVLDYYSKEKNKLYVSFSDTSSTENFEKEELYFKEIKESGEK